MAKKKASRPDRESESNLGPISKPDPVDRADDIIEEIRTIVLAFWTGTRLERDSWHDWLERGATGKPPSTDNPGLLKLVEALEFRRAPTPDTAPQHDESTRAKPIWDRGNRNLQFNGKIAKHYRQIAENQMLILDSFQEQNWQPTIDDPLQNKKGEDAKSRLSETIKSLNTGMTLLAFSGNGKGTGIVWREKK